VEHEEDVRDGARLKRPPLLRQPLLGAETTARVASELSPRFAMPIPALYANPVAHRALRQVGEDRMSFRGSKFVGMAGQHPRRLQFVGIAKFLGPPARQRRQPCLGLKGDRRLPAGAGDHRARPSGLQPRRAGRNAGPSDDDAVPKIVPPQRTRGLPDRPAISAPVPPGSPVPSASALSISTLPYPLLQATIQLAAAALP
jgi:hypothetical protein